MFEIGNTLRETRRRQGLGLEEAAAAMLVRARYLEALEGERFDLLPDGFYRRSFLRAYADYLDLDGDAFVAEYELRFAEVPEAEADPPALRRAIRRPRLPERPLALAGIAVAVAALLGLGAYGIAGGGGGGRPPRAAAGHAVTPRTRARVQHTRPALTPPRHAAPEVLTLRASRGACWIEVRLGSAAGATVYDGTLLPGEQQRFGVTRALWIRLGAPKNLDATLVGHNVTTLLPHGPGDVLASSRGLVPSP